MSEKYTKIVHGFSYRRAELAPNLEEQVGNTRGSTLDTAEPVQKGLGKETGGVHVQNKLLERVKPAL